MGLLSFSRVLVGVTLVTGVALAQHGLIVEPWRRTAAPIHHPARPTPTRVMPSSGLAPASVVPMASPQRKLAPALPVKWSPPVVQLLVDPWVQATVAAPVARPAASQPRALRAPRAWVPTTEIVDPWADAGAKSVASYPPAPPRATIF